MRRILLLSVLVASCSSSSGGAGPSTGDPNETMAGDAVDAGSASGQGQGHGRGHGQTAGDGTIDGGSGSKSRGASDCAYCIPQTVRWCDDPVYCNWGKQSCLPDGTWGPCTEVQETPAGCTGRGFSGKCCEALGLCCGWTSTDVVGNCDTFCTSTPPGSSTEPPDSGPPPQSDASTAPPDDSGPAVIR
jgi:hypothetical protein